MTTMTAHSVKARNLKHNDTIDMATFQCNITSIVKTNEVVVVTGEYADEIGSLVAESVYAADEYVTVFMPS